MRVTKRQSVARVVKRGLRYTVACDDACRVSATLRIAGGDRQRLGTAAARRIGAGDSRRLVLRLDRNVRQNLASAMRKAKLRNLRATLVLKIRTADGTTTVRKAVVLQPISHRPARRPPHGEAAAGHRLHRTSGLVPSDERIRDMAVSDENLTPRPEHRFTFGLWTVGNPGRDPFGGPTREPIDPSSPSRSSASSARGGSACTTRT